MKAKMTTLICAIILLLIAMSTSAQSCSQCIGVNATCTQLSDVGQGWTFCLGGQTDCHDGTQGPCAAHCHIGNEMCGCSSYQMDPCGFQWTCLDENFNGICDINEEGGGSGGDGTALPGCPNSPIVIRMARGAWKFTGPPVSFDLSGDGAKSYSAWPVGEIAFLAVDRNGNGVIDNGYELFGDYGLSKVMGDKTKWNGFEWLRLSDANGNRMIDEFDPIWPRLLLWVDRNHDGISQPSELSSLKDSGITALGLDYHWTGRRDGTANVFFRYEAILWRGNEREPYYDVYLTPMK